MNNTNKHSSYKDLEKLYLESLLDGDRFQASKMILETVEKGAPVKDIYLHVFQSSQYRIGELWQTNKISVAQEHYCTAATQLIMSQLYTHIFNSDKIGRSLVATCVGGELHEIGVRMVADFFEMEGWDTYYLGANSPVDAILAAIHENKPDALAVSVTISFNMKKVEEIISAIKNDELGKDVKIIVGGRPFNANETLWKELKADGYASDANSAIETATKLIQ